MINTIDSKPETMTAKAGTALAKSAPNLPPTETVVHRVKATREGLMGGRTASGYSVDLYVPFVALPAIRAVGKFVRVTNLENGQSAIAWVGDVGPWNEQDDLYVFGTAQPQAESGRDSRGRKTNGAGIDLGEFVWKALGMIDNGPVEWEFLS